MPHSNWKQLMWYAVAHNDPEAIKDLLAVPEVQEALLRGGEQEWWEEEAPLHLAAYYGYNGIIELLVANNLDIDSYNVYQPDQTTGSSGARITPLHYAAYKNKVGTVQLLLALGADPRLYGEWGNCKGSPRQFAVTRNALDEALTKHVKVARLLKEAEEREEQYEDLLLNPSKLEDEENELSAPELQRLIAIKETTKKDLLAQASHLEKEVKALKTRLTGHHLEIGQLRGEEEDEVTCPVCLCTPRRKVFTCVVCSAALCNACQGRIKSCPCCRADFETYGRPKRNKWAEILVKKLAA